MSSRIMRPAAARKPGLALVLSNASTPSFSLGQPGSACDADSFGKRELREEATSLAGPLKRQRNTDEAWRAGMPDMTRRLSYNDYQDGEQARDANRRQREARRNGDQRLLVDDAVTGQSFLFYCDHRSRI
jgi:hypothetical protein